MLLDPLAEPRVDCPTGGTIPEDLVIRPVSDFPKFDYSMKEVVRAGEALAGDLIWTPESEDNIRQVFKVANNWRDSHAYPMRKLRYELIGQIRRKQVSGGQTAARLKRMPSIRNKLRRLPGKLNQIQDLAGCRAILPSMKDVSAVIEGLRTGTSHELRNEYDYINNPKSDGYRCYHMVFSFKGDGDDKVFDGRRVEIQIRSHVQHSWATAVEAVGMFRREDLKGGHGNADWLHLFQLMSAEIALAEGCAPDGDEPVRPARINELIELEQKLNAIQILEDIRQAVRYVDEYVKDADYVPEYYLLKYDRSKGSVTVQPYRESLSGVKSLDSVEVASSESGEKGVNIVLVEVDGIENLKAAYPNYFGDVQMFKNRLQSIVGKDDSFTLTPQKIAPQKPYEKPDFSWIGRSRLPKPKGA